MNGILTENKGAYVPAEQQYLHVTIAFAPFDMVLPAVAGLFRAVHGFSRAVENSDETLWTRFERLERERDGGDHIGTVQAVRVIEPETTPGATIIEDYFGLDPDQLSALLPEVGLLSLMSEYHQKRAERHSYTWRDGGKVRRHAYIHHNYQESGWDWQTKGPVLDWEDAERIAAKRVSQRCDRALMIDYAGTLGCDLHGPLARGDWSRAVTIHEIDERDFRETPAPIDWGEEYRRLAVARRFGKGEEGLTFAGFLADNHFFDCLRSYCADTQTAIDGSRSARQLFEVMRGRGIAPDWQDVDCSDLGLWNNALRHAYAKFPNAAGLHELERLAVAETRKYRYPLNELRLRNLYASAHGHPTETDPGMMTEIAKGAAAHWLGR